MNIDNYGLLHCTLLKLTLSEYTVEALVVREDEVEDGKETDAFTAEAIFFFRGKYSHTIELNGVVRTFEERRHIQRYFKNKKTKIFKRITDWVDKVKGQTQWLLVGMDSMVEERFKDSMEIRLSIVTKNHSCFVAFT